MSVCLPSISLLLGARHIVQSLFVPESEMRTCSTSLAVLESANGLPKIAQISFFDIAA